MFVLSSSVDLSGVEYVDAIFVSKRHQFLSNLVIIHCHRSYHRVGHWSILLNTIQGVCGSTRTRGYTRIRVSGMGRRLTGRVRVGTHRVVRSSASTYIVS